MTKNNNHFSKRFFGGLLAFVIAFTFVPFSRIGKIASKASDEITITNPDFSTTSTSDSTGITASGWTATLSSDSDSSATTLGGRISSSAINWNKDYEKFIDSWLTSWKASSPKYSNNTAIASSDINSVAALLKVELIANMPKCPDVSGYVLMLQSGLQVVAIKGATVAETTFDLTTSKEVFYTFSQTATLSAYGYYKLSVDVLLLGTDTTASIYVDGIKIADEKHGSYSIESATSFNYYIYNVYENADDEDPTKYVSTTAPAASATILLNEVSYAYPAEGFVKETSHASSTGDAYAVYAETVNAVDKNDWETYTYYFSTKESTSSAKLTLGLGESTSNLSSGTAYFDNVKLEKLSYEEFATTAPSTATDTSSNADVERFTTVANNFDAEGKVWTETTTPQVGTTASVANGVMTIAQPNTVAATFKSGSFSVDRLGFSRVSVWVKGDTSTSSFTLKIESVIDAEKLNGKSVSASQTASLSSSTANKWQEYAFYIYGNPYYNVDLTLSFTTATTGNFEIDNLIVEKITPAQYGVVSANTLKLNTTSPTETITNGYFNTYSSVNSPVSTILPPTGWSIEEEAYSYKKDSTVSTLTEIKLSEISYTSDTTINYAGNTYTNSTEKPNEFTFANSTTEKTEKITYSEKFVFYSWNVAKQAYYNEAYSCINDRFDASNYVTIGAREDADTVPNYSSVRNVLKIKSDTHLISVASPTISISASTIYRLSFFADIEGDQTVSIYLKDSDQNIVSELSISGVGDWFEYNFYIRGGLSAESLRMVIEANGGTNYFTNVKLVSDDPAFVSKLSTSKTSSDSEFFAMADFLEESFANHAYHPLADLYESYSYKKTDTSTGKLGVIDTKDADTSYKTTYSTALSSYDDEKSSKALLIENANGQNTTVYPLNNKTLAKSSYYMATVYVKTLAMSEGSSLNILFNATSGEKSISENFICSSTSSIGEEDLNGYAKYVLYIATGDYTFADYNVQISLDGQGTILVGTINLETSTETVFNAVTTNDQTKSLSFLSQTTTSSTNTTDTTTDTTDEELAAEKKEQALILFFIVFSSIALVAAIVIALVFVIGKKLPKHNKKINTKTKGPEDQRGFI